MQAAREAARRLQCGNNLKQLALAVTTSRRRGQLPYGRKYDIWDAYSWSVLVLPYIEQQAVYDGYWTLPQTGYTPSRLSPEPQSAWVAGDDSRMRAPDHDHSGVFLPQRHCAGAQSNATAQWGYYRCSYRGCTGSGDAHGDAIRMNRGTRGSHRRLRFQAGLGSDEAAALDRGHLRRHFGRHVGDSVAFRRTSAGPGGVGLGRSMGRNFLRQHGRRPVLDGADAEFRRAGRGMRMVSGRRGRYAVRAPMHDAGLESAGHAKRGRRLRRRPQCASRRGQCRDGRRLRELRRQFRRSVYLAKPRNAGRKRNGCGKLVGDAPMKLRSCMALTTGLSRVGRGRLQAVHGCQRPGDL